MTRTASPVVAIIQARMTSSRLAGKVLMPLAGAPLVRRAVERVLRIAGVDKVVVALADGAAHDPVTAALSGLDVVIIRGSEEDVLSRTAAAARAADAVTVMRITSDCPLIDPSVSASVLAAYEGARGAGIVYARTAIENGFPLGFDTEVFPAAILYEAEATAQDHYEREHVTPYLWRRPDAYPAIHITALPDRRSWRLVVDTQDDYRLASAIYDALYDSNPCFGYAELIALFSAQPELLHMNANVMQRPYIGLS